MVIMEVTRCENRNREEIRMENAKVGDHMEKDKKILQVFKFQSNLWIETAQLSRNDIAVVVDQTEERIFFWQGKWAKPKVLEQAKKNLLTKRTQYTTYTYHQNHGEFPSAIQRELTQRMENAQNS